jgi:hypothetical protein
MKKHYLMKLCIFGVCMIVFVCITVGIVRGESAYNENTLKMVEENIKKAAMTCYSVEGFYPSSITYLEENYSLVVDTDKVNVFYQTVGSNLFPDIVVTYKGNAS